MPIPAIVAASIIGGGAGIGASLIAKKGQQNVASQQQEQANQMFAASRPAYNQAQSYYSGLMQNPLQQPDIANAQMQFGQAKNNLINSSTSRGGGLDAGMANLEAGKAATISQLIAGGRQQGAAGLTNLAAGQGAQGLSALAGAQQSQYQNSLLQQNAYGGIGSFLTRLMSGLPQQQSNSYSSIMSQPTTASNIPAAIIPRTGQMYPGATDPFTSNF